MLIRTDVNGLWLCVDLLEKASCGLGHIKTHHPSLQLQALVHHEHHLEVHVLVVFVDVLLLLVIFVLLVLVLIEHLLLLQILIMGVVTVDVVVVVMPAHVMGDAFLPFLSLPLRLLSADQLLLGLELLPVEDPAPALPLLTSSAERETGT